MLSQLNNEDAAVGIPLEYDSVNHQLQYHHHSYQQYPQYPQNYEGVAGGQITQNPRPSTMSMMKHVYFSDNSPNVYQQQQQHRRPIQSLTSSSIGTLPTTSRRREMSSSMLGSANENCLVYAASDDRLYNKNEPGSVLHSLRSLNELIAVKNEELRRQKVIIRKLYRALEEKDRYLVNLENELNCQQKQAILNNSSGELKPAEMKTSTMKQADRRRVKRLAISGESSQFLLAQTQVKCLAASVYPKSKSVKELIHKSIMTNDLMKHFAPEQVEEIIDAIFPIFYKRSSWIIREGETGSILYVIEYGLVEVTKDGHKIREMTTGQIFGELAILYNCIRTASVRALTDCSLWAIDRQIFQTITMQTGMKRLEEYKKFLKSVPIFNSLSPEVLSKVADELYMVHYKEGEYVIREGARGDTFYIISRGQVKVTKNQSNKSEEKFIRTMGPGEWFGEKALIYEDTRTANIIASTPSLECLVLDREFYNLLIKDLKSLERKYSDETEKPTKKGYNSELREQYKNLKLTDLTYVTTIGLGGFARVELVHMKNSPGKSFALKKLKKQSIIKMRQKEHIINERNILLEVNSDFIVKLYRTFKDKYYVYFLMEVCLGGELWTILRCQTSFDDSTTRFYTACVINALDYLHNRGIIYRDLKPENLILDAKGYCKLADFGFAKRIGFASKTWTFCGTPEYVAPEIILNKGHDFSADIWSLGILMFELLTGLPPFTTNEPMTIYNDILKGISVIQFPEQITRNAANLIKKLCKENPNERLGNGKSIVKVKKHVWFEGFNWVGLTKRTIKPPIMPKIKSPIDASNFDLYEHETKLPDEETSGWDKDF